jgi:hypothetical protein
LRQKAHSVWSNATELAKELLAFKRFAGMMPAQKMGTAPIAVRFKDRTRIPRGRGLCTDARPCPEGA